MSALPHTWENEMKLFARFKQSDRAPLLSDAEMAELNEKIFGEDVSAERLLAIFSAMPAADRQRAEWVMDAHTLNRIRKAHLQPQWSGMYLNPRNFEQMRNALDDRIFGLPVAIEPFAKLALRVRA